MLLPLTFDQLQVFGGREVAASAQLMFVLIVACLHTCTYILHMCFICVYIYTDVYAGMYVCMYVCMYVRKCVHVHVQACMLGLMDGSMDA